jgi:hypothetical protein
MITNQNVYNLKIPDAFNNFFGKIFSSAILRRKIPLKKIFALTLSKTSFEFVIHVPEEYDYRYSSPDKLIFVSFLFITSSSFWIAKKKYLYNFFIMFLFC